MKMELLLKVLGLAVSCGIVYFSTHVRIDIYLMVFGVLFAFLFFVGTLETLCENTRFGDMMDKFFGRED